jgi:hypothetical protein
MTTRLRIGLGLVLLAIVVSVAVCVRRGSDPLGADARKSERATSASDSPERERDDDSEPEPDDPNDPDEPEDPQAFRSGARTTAGATRADAAAAPLPPAAPTASATRTGRLHTRVLQEAARHNWVPIDDSDTPCPPDRIQIVYAPPPNLRQYTKGAYFEPLGPAPAETTDEVNGLLICEGHPFLYRGFEAYYRADSGRWDVFPFPVIE